MLGRFKLSKTVGGAIETFTSPFFPTGTFVIPSQSVTLNNSFYLANHGFPNSSTVSYLFQGASNVSGMTDAASYQVEVINADRFRLLTNTSSPTQVDLYNFGSAVLEFSFSNINSNRNMISIPDHDIYIGMSLLYSNLGNTSIVGLSNNNAYYVTYSYGSNIRVASSPGGTSIDFVTPASNTHLFYSLDGSADGNYAIVAAPTPNKLTFATNLQAQYTYRTFNGYLNINLRENAIQIDNHGIETGTEVEINQLSGTNTAIDGITFATTYYAIRKDIHHVALATSATNATNGVAVAITGKGAEDASYSITIKSLLSLNRLNGSCYVTSNTPAVSSDNINFVSLFRPADTVSLDVAKVVRSFPVQSVAFEKIAFTSNHNFVNGDAIYYLSSNANSVPITGLSLDSMYYVRSNLPNEVYLFNASTSAVNNQSRIVVSSPTVPTGSNMGIFASISATFLPAAIDTTAHTITFTQPHYLTSGDVLRYSVSGTAIANLSNNYLYYANPVVSSNVSLHPSFLDALSNTNKIQYSSSNVFGTFSLVRLMDSYNTYISKLRGPSFLDVGVTFPEYRTGMLVSKSSAMYPTVNGVTFHRAFDGGVQLFPSTSPYSSVIRQTRRYFKYQSGKGMQVSFAINFNAPTDIDKLYQATINAVTVGIIETKAPHRVAPTASVRIQGATDTTWNRTFVVSSVLSPYKFAFTITGTIDTQVAQGSCEFFVTTWENSLLRTGMFDDQNGVFFEFDGSQVYAARRNSMYILKGTVSVTYGSQYVQGASTSFTTELVANDMIVIRGQSYKVITILNNTELYVQPHYRGVTSSKVHVTKTSDYKVARTQWSLDKCDGTGPSGYNLDLNMVQMAVVDFSWYGAGKIRFGFKDTRGDVRYVHEMVHNNVRSDAFLRSGNLPCRYEVTTTGVPTYVPSLMHWGVSAVMDGRYDDDRTFLFNASGNMLTFTNDVPLSFFGTINAVDQAAKRITVTTYSSIQLLRPGLVLTSSDTLPSNTKIVSIAKNGSAGYVYIDSTPLAITSANTRFVTESIVSTLDTIPSSIPILSLRVAPSADNGIAGSFGNRDTTNRMQIVLRSIDVLTTNDCEVRLLLNGYPSNRTWDAVAAPSLGQVITHKKGDTVSGGTNLYTFRVQGGRSERVYNAGNSDRRYSTIVNQTLTDIAALGNAIMGGDGVFPDGPDVVSVVAQCLDFNGISTSSPFTVSARLTWSETHA